MFRWEDGDWRVYGHQRGGGRRKKSMATRRKRIMDIYWVVWWWWKSMVAWLRKGCELSGEKRRA